MGNDNDADPAAYEPHYATIDDAEQVQIYESIMGNTDGEVTTTLLRGAGYLKDNRLLPSGFDKDTVGADIACAGRCARGRGLWRGRRPDPVCHRTWVRRRGPLR